MRRHHLDRQYQPTEQPLHLKFSLLRKDQILLLPTCLESVRRSQSILHELHIRHLTVPINLTPNRKWARARLTKRSGAVGKAAENSDILSAAEQGVDFERFIGPDLIHG